MLIEARLTTPPDVTLRRTTPDDIPECGRILYEAFASLADRHGFPHDFESVEVATRSMRALISNPGFHGVAAELDGLRVSLRRGGSRQAGTPESRCVRDRPARERQGRDPDRRPGGDWQGDFQAARIGGEYTGRQPVC